MISRRKLLTGAAALAAYASLPSPAKALTGCIPGAIRFDPWYTTGSTSSIYQNYISPQTWQFRAPWFCQAANANLLSCNALQANMDSEIQCAVNAGFKFWAYNQAGTGSTLGVAWGLHQSSSLKNSVSWCWISDLGILGNAGNFSTQVANYVTNYQASNYFTLLSGRPVHFIFWNSVTFASNWGSSLANVAAMITALRAACVTAGVGNPYIVVMDFSATSAASEAAGIGADAISFYNDSSFGTYPQLVTAVQNLWTSYGSAASGASLGFVPTAQTGWDRRPQYQSPTGTAPYTYLNEPAPLVGMLNTTTPGSNAQIATHVGAGVTFVKANTGICVSTAMLVCAWDECSEEGSPVVPSIGDPLQAGNTNNILTALAAVLN